MTQQPIPLEDRRAGFRVPSQLPGEVLAEGSGTAVVVTDVSTGGAAFSAPRAALPMGLPLGGLVPGRDVTMILRICDTNLMVAGTIAWSRLVSGADEIDRVQGGIRFAELDTDTRFALLVWLQHALNVVQSAALLVLEERWNEAAHALGTIGFQTASRDAVERVLRYAATGRKKSSAAIT